MTAILNSKYLTYYFKIKFKDKHLAGGYLAINKGTIEEFPVPTLSNEVEKKLTFISKKLHHENLDVLKRIKRIELETEIDLIVHKAFEIEYDLMRTICPDIQITKDEYNSIEY